MEASLNNNIPPSPIFIHGIHRSGTNFIWRLLLLHADCHIGSVGEDFLLKHAHLLKQFSDKVYRDWIPRWENRMGGSPNYLLDFLGQSLIFFTKPPFYNYDGEFVEEMTEKKLTNDDVRRLRLVSKTPSLNNLPLFFNLFTDAHLILIIRDGRSVVESSMKTFGWSFEKCIERWVAAAEKIFAFDKNDKEFGARYSIVRFEDIYNNPKAEMLKLLPVLNLDKEKYNFDKILSLPIYGSSEIRKSGEEMHWKPVQKKDSFDPVNRWNYWDDRMHDRFNWLAGDMMEAFGYSLKPTQNKILLNRGKDITVNVMSVLRKAKGKLTGGRSFERGLDDN